MSSVTSGSVAGIAGLNPLQGKPGGNTAGRLLTKTNEGMQSLSPAWQPPMTSMYNAASGAAASASTSMRQAVDQWADMVVGLFNWSSPETSMA
ncbi:MAG: hypothetical protein ACRBCT_07855 [Alphaproteobacteria bacterium]